MAVAPKIIYQCNHILEEYIKQYGCIEMKRESVPGFPDKLAANIDIVRIDSVFDSKKENEYSVNVDYEQKASQNIIEWINQENSPPPGGTYFITGCYLKVSTKKYDGDTCIRCGGNGWYAKIFSDKSISVVSLQDKLVQDFIKVLFTEKGESGYGSRMRDIIGSNAHNEIELGLQVSDIMTDCENQIKKSQREHMNGGSELEMEEQLASIVVKDVVFIRDENTCYISVELINAYQEVVNFGFKV